MVLHANFLRQCFQWLTISDICKMERCSKQMLLIVDYNQITWKFFLHRDFITFDEHLLFDVCIIEKSITAKQIYKNAKDGITCNELMTIARKIGTTTPSFESVQKAYPYVLQAVCKNNFGCLISLVDLNLFLFEHNNNNKKDQYLKQKSKLYLDLLFNYVNLNIKFTENIDIDYDFMGCFYSEFFHDEEKSYWSFKKGLKRKIFDCFASIVKYHASKLSHDFFFKMYNIFKLPEERAAILYQKAMLISQKEEKFENLMTALIELRGIEIML